MLNLDFYFSSGGSLASIGWINIFQFSLGAHPALLALLVKCVAAAVINLFQKFPSTLGTLFLLHNGSGGGKWHREKQQCQGWEGTREETVENPKTRKKDSQGEEDKCEQNRAPKAQGSIYSIDNITSPCFSSLQPIFPIVLLADVKSATPSLTTEYWNKALHWALSRIPWVLARVGCLEGNTWTYGPGLPNHPAGFALKGKTDHTLCLQLLKQKGVQNQVIPSETLLLWKDAAY